MTSAELAFERWWELNRERIKHNALWSRKMRSQIADGFLDSEVRELCWEAFRDSLLWRIEVK